MDDRNVDSPNSPEFSAKTNIHWVMFVTRLVFACVLCVTCHQKGPWCESRIISDGVPKVNENIIIISVQGKFWKRTKFFLLLNILICAAHNIRSPIELNDL